MTGMEQKRLDEIKARLSKNTSGEAALLWKSPLAKIVLEDVEFLLGLVEHLHARAGECDVDPEVAKLTGRVRLLEGDVSNLKAAVDELRRPTEQARDLIANARDDIQALRTAVEFLTEKRSAQQAKIEELQRRIAEFMR